MNNKVSICVISYNSQDTILSTLNSILNQTYKNSEIIISDDNSQDNTIDIVKEWCRLNESVQTLIIQSSINTGVTKNVNRACSKASGDYIKILAADDCLTPTYLENCVRFFSDHKNASLLFTKVKFINQQGKEISGDNFCYSFFDYDSADQYKYIIENGVPLIPTPSAIYRADILRKLNFFDERIPMWEDGPMYFRLSQNSIKFYLLDQELVLYRIHDQSLSHTVPIAHRKSIALFNKLYMIPIERKYNFAKSLRHQFKFWLMYHSDKKIPSFLLNLIEKRSK